MKHLTSDQLADFSAIYEDDVELVSVSGRPLEAFGDLSRWLNASRRELRAQWVQTVAGADESATAMASVVDAPMFAELSRELLGPVEVLSELLGCEAVGIRAATLRGPMCPRFHRDHVPCRLLITVDGDATEWISHDEVDEAALADRDNQAPPVITGKEIRQLATGSWSLLKGGAWDPEISSGVVHRSPSQHAPRLLLSFDPLFSQDASAQRQEDKAGAPESVQ